MSQPGRPSPQPATFWRVTGPIAIGLVLALSLWLTARSIYVIPVASIPRGGQRVYTTHFGNDENPLSEHGVWINGKDTALDWSDVRASSGLAFGTDSGTVKYADSTALLTGSWGPDQSVEARVYSVNQNDLIFEEVELRLRSVLSAHSATGYEINFRCSKTRNAYTQIVRWNGRLGSFTYLKTATGSQYGVKNGDVVKATVTGNRITAYINGIAVLRASDRTYAAGNPGIGFYLEGSSGVNRDFGFTAFRASDGPGSDSRL